MNTTISVTMSVEELESLFDKKLERIYHYVEMRTDIYKEEQDVYIGVKEIANKLGVSSSTVRRYMDAGFIDNSLIGGRRKALMSDVDKFIVNVRPSWKKTIN